MRIRYLKLFLSFLMKFSNNLIIVIYSNTCDLDVTFTKWRIPWRINWKAGQTSVHAIRKAAAATSWCILQGRIAVKIRPPGAFNSARLMDEGDDGWRRYLLVCQRRKQGFVTATISPVTRRICLHSVNKTWLSLTNKKTNSRRRQKWVTPRANHVYWRFRLRGR